MIPKTQNFSGQRIHLFDTLYFIAEKFNADRLVRPCRKYIDDISANP